MTMADAAPTTEVFRADANHLDALAPLFDAYRVFYKQPSDLAAARRFLTGRLSDGDGSVFFIARRDGELVGFTRMWRVHSSIATRPAWILEDLYVIPSMRKAGIARALMERAARHAREDEAVFMSLETAHDNHPAQTLYDSLGYLRESAFYKYNLLL
jgi:ribosomal protein S18 acetylase RimI-like enzyme